MRILLDESTPKRIKGCLRETKCGRWLRWLGRSEERTLDTIGLAPMEHRPFDSRIVLFVTVARTLATSMWRYRSRPASFSWRKRFSFLTRAEKRIAAVRKPPHGFPCIEPDTIAWRDIAASARRAPAHFH